MNTFLVVQENTCPTAPWTGAFKDIRVPAALARPENLTVLVMGCAMYPTLRGGSVVGVETGEDFISNEVYAVRPRSEWISVKRVILDRERLGYILRSDNPDKDKYPDLFIPLAFAKGLIVGRVVWSWQGM